MEGGLSIAFQGAARTVTGSRHRLRFGGRSWLFDCGIFQGRRDEAEQVNRTFAFDPRELDTVVVSHAHLDHTGNLPTLVNQGFRGAVHATPATAELTAFMLEDSAVLQEQDVAHVNRHASGRPPRRPLYTTEDVRDTLQRFQAHVYHEDWPLFDDVQVRYYDAGHILGSALTTFEFQRNGSRYRLGMSGDLGRHGRRILQDPETHAGVDALVLESTYGNRIHAGIEDSERSLADVVSRTAARGGRLLVPAFAVGRTQELVATLHSLHGRGLCPSLPIVVDSPMARRATAVFVRHPEHFDAETRRLWDQSEGEPLGFTGLRYVSSVEESKALNDRRDSFVLIAGSGMCEGGRIVHHLRHGLGDSRNTVLFVGYQAEATLGRRILEGRETVNVLGEPVRVRAEIASLQGFSAHADQSELLAWVERLAPRPRRIFLVHGEVEAAEPLAERLRERVGADVRIPERGEEFDLWS